MNNDSEKDAMDAYIFKKSVDHPKHYNNSPSGTECIDIIEHMTLNQGTAIKYLWRLFDKDDPIEQLEKAIWYCNREKQRLLKIKAEKLEQQQTRNVGITP